MTNPEQLARIGIDRLLTAAGCAVQDWQLDDEFDCVPEEQARSVPAPDRIRTIARAMRARWQTELFPRQREPPRTLVFANNDNHAEPIVGILREEWSRGNEFAQKITYRTTVSKPVELIRASCPSSHRRTTATKGSRH